MCGRFTLRTPASLLASWFEHVDFPVIALRYNIAPSQQILALRPYPDNQIQASWLRWGLVPSWAADLKIGNQLINARSETAASKPAFRRAFKSQRCVILADGFYEWKQSSSGKQPFLIQATDAGRPLFCFAGLWERWHRPTENEATENADSKKLALEKTARQLELFDLTNDASFSRISEPESKIVETCTILTTAANERMAEFHDRMPCILDSQALTSWLDQSCVDLAHLNSLLKPCPDDQLRIHAVAKLVNKPAVDHPECAEPISVQNT